MYLAAKGGVPEKGKTGTCTPQSVSAQGAEGDGNMPEPGSEEEP